jgi:hypothetical protein
MTWAKVLVAHWPLLRPHNIQLPEVEDDHA